MSDTQSQFDPSNLPTEQILPALIAILIGLPLVAGFLKDDGSADDDDDDQIEFVTTEAAKELGYPFSTAVLADDFVFLSGTLGTVPGTPNKLADGMAGQAKQVMENIKANLELVDLGMKDIVKCTVMIDDMSQWPAFNEIYKNYFDGNYPARSAFGADGLALGAAVEVECIAHRGD